jgi:iron(III)-salmochelin esterase
VQRSLDRRSFLAGGAALALGACSKGTPPSSTSTSAHTSGPPPPGGTWRMATFDAAPDIPEGQRAQILDPWPAKGGPNAHHRPLLVALHGRGEAGRGLEVGANAWPHDYELDQIHRRLYAPPLVAADLHNMTNVERIEKLNASMIAAPYHGIAVACPYTPHLSDSSQEGARPFGRFVVDHLLRRLRDDTGSKVDRKSVGIDGVSMGGRLALFIGLAHPEIFGVVGALQPALRDDEAPLISVLARLAMEKAKVKLRLVTSDDDYYLGAVVATSTRLRMDGVDHELLVIPGSHSYEFNRGPGGAEMLLWHERVQRGLPSPGLEPSPGPTGEATTPPF